MFSFLSGFGQKSDAADGAARPVSGRPQAGAQGPEADNARARAFRDVFAAVAAPPEAPRTPHLVLPAASPDVTPSDAAPPPEGSGADALALVPQSWRDAGLEGVDPEALDPRTVGEILQLLAPPEPGAPAGESPLRQEFLELIGDRLPLGTEPSGQDELTSPLRQEFLAVLGDRLPPMAERTTQEDSLPLVQSGRDRTPGLALPGTAPFDGRATPDATTTDGQSSDAGRLGGMALADRVTSAAKGASGPHQSSGGASPLHRWPEAFPQSGAARHSDMSSGQTAAISGNLPGAGMAEPGRQANASSTPVRASPESHDSDSVNQRAKPGPARHVSLGQPVGLGAAASNDGIPHATAQLPNSPFASGSGPAGAAKEGAALGTRRDDPASPPRGDAPPVSSRSAGMSPDAARQPQTTDASAHGDKQAHEPSRSAPRLPDPPLAPGGTAQSGANAAAAPPPPVAGTLAEKAAELRPRALGDDLAIEARADIRSHVEAAHAPRAAATAAPPTPGAGHGPAGLSHQIASAIQASGERSFDIVLSPAELGKVRISLTPADGGMSVSIVADRPETLDLLRRHVDVLAQDLRDVGYGSAEFSFAADDQGQGSSGGAPAGAVQGPLGDIPQSEPESAPTDGASGLDLSGHMDIRI